MIEDVYNRLAGALNARSVAYPSIPCDEFYAFARELFTPEQAEIACSMPIGSATAEDLASKMKGTNVEDLRKQLEEMVNKGVVRSREKDGKRYYELLPIVPGILEFQFMHGRVDERTKRLAQLLKSYGKAMKNIMMTAPPPSAAADTSATKKVPVEEEIFDLSTILPYDEVMKLIDKTEYIAAGTCVCRHQGDLLDRPCDKPKNNLCMIFGPSAQFANSHGFVRLLSKEEARKSIDEAEKAGLVHNFANSNDKFIDLLCNCCGCHCPFLRGAARSPVPNKAFIANWIVKIDDDACTGCGACVDRCWMKALKMDGDLAVRDANRCIGCGICMYVCPTDAMKMARRETAAVTG
ncbi:MAG: 4Fe-4S dicluster domain-containing protein [Chloroflexi bacterium]|nr:4Fe-4S dicluster domain-containing protein [Chloroflexota bacterium]